MNPALVAFCLLSVAPETVPAHPPRPDIVFILADDLGRLDVGFMGGKEILTPNLDRLAAAGARLEQFYVQPLCTPTRAALLTGRYPMRYGLQVGVIRPDFKYALSRDERTLPEALRQAGYSTAMCGKWHLGSAEKAFLPTSRGFDRFYGNLFGSIDYFTHVRAGILDWHRDGEPNRDEGYSTHLVAREAVKVISEQPKEKPLFLYVAFNAVHAPLQVPGKYTEPYARLQGKRRTYAGMVAAMDEAVGQIAAALDESGRRKNALIIFASDNGGPHPGEVTDNGPLREGKNTLYEGGVRVAAFTAWEGRIKPGTVIHEPLHVVDWYPTLLKLAGSSLEQAQPLDGRDILPCLTEGKPSPHGEILVNATPREGAMRAGDWKLIVRQAPGGTMELYDLARDPGEKEDLAARQPDRVMELRARYDALAKQAVAPLHP